MEPSTTVFLMASGGLGTALIIFGILGWEKTREVLLALAGRKPNTRKKRTSKKRGQK